MKTNYYNKYMYTELRDAALAPEASLVDIDTLGEWFSDYGDVYWNGEYYDVDGIARIIPVYSDGGIVCYDLQY